MTSHWHPCLAGVDLSINCDTRDHKLTEWYAFAMIGVYPVQDVDGTP